MAQTLERLTHRTQTMTSIRGIVRTMKTMSAINALPYEQAAQAIEAYQDTVLQGFHAFVRCHGPLPDEADPDAAPIVIVFGSDHGLCGNYNEIVATEAQTLASPGAQVICIGAQMEDALFGQGIRPVTTLLPPATADGLARLSGRLITLLDQMRPSGRSTALSVSLVNMERAAHGLQNPVTQQLLPLERSMTKDLAHRPWTSRSLPQFRMEPDHLLASLIRSYLFARLYRSAAEAMVTENAARLARMQQAEQSIDDQLEVLNAELRTVRQSEITTELLDVIIGFEALKKRDKRKPEP
ncbi:F0F1 ATP synthase subunit gamma [Aliiroseovarius sp. S1339]|uniref:F0F1 ATP synthase subunit gamma n=1 Tax=Aliiroseovarius sp. S1339 TaxID=2936990 RepID=UPI0020C06CA3|nr:FoF1 ATP synthase subunit gamma [Aliiroseovarius sp. S1339]MCK8465521.1 F0F1 ATP synthase subunit gamma [Aliiroseovarius sp. S1339]